MRVLVLSNLYPPHAVGGYEEICRWVVDHLRARGHEVRVLTSTHGVACETREGHVHRRLWLHGYFGRRWLSIPALFFLERRNHAVLEEELAAFAPEVAYVWNMSGLSKGLLLTLQARGGSVVYDVHDHWIARRADVWLNWWNGLAGGAAGRIVRAWLRATGLAGWIARLAPFAPWSALKFTRICFCSEALRQFMVERGHDVGHGVVIPCGIPVERFRPRPENERFTRLLYVGRLSADKDPLTALRALKLLPEDFTLTLVGRGEDDYAARLRAEAAPLGARVAFRAAAPEEMAGLYADHDALLFTSAWAEPFALTPLEAMAAGVPVIATLEGGTRELVRDGANALAFRTRDPADLAAQVRRLAADPALRRRLAAAAAAEVREKYGVETMTRRMEALLIEAAGG